MNTLSVRLLAFATAAIVADAGGEEYDTGFRELQDMIAFSSDRDDRPSDVYLVDGRGQAVLHVTNHKRSEPLVGPRWGQGRPRMTEIVNVFTPQYDEVLGETRYIGGLSYPKTTEVHLRNDPAADQPEELSHGPRRLFVSHSDAEGGFDIYSYGYKASHRARLTHEPNSFHPVWSPDGEWIAFLSDRHGKVELYRMRWGGGEVTRLAPNLTAYRPRWAWPDGERLAFFSDDSGIFDVFVVDVEGKTLVNVTKDPVGTDAFVWSSDGAEIAFRSDRDGNSEIYAVRADGANLRNVTNHPANDTGPIWLSQGGVRSLVYGAAVDESALISANRPH